MQPLDPRRAVNIGASEVPALFSAAWADEAASPDDLDPYETRYALWMRKKGRLPHRPDDGPPAGRGALRDRKFWGSILEPAIAKGIELLTGWEVAPGGFCPHPAIAGMSATPDYFARGPGLDAVLEIKNVDRLVFSGGGNFPGWPQRVEPGVYWRVGDGWELAEVQPPFAIKLQVQAQMACTGKESSVTAPLIGGNDAILYRVDRHPGTVARIEAEIRLFWESIAADAPPAPDWSLDAETVAALNGAVDPGTLLDLRGDAGAQELAHLYYGAQKEEVEAKRRKKGFGAQILDLVGPAERAIFDGGYSLWAGEVAGGHRSYDVEPYRGFKLTQSSKRR